MTTHLLVLFLALVPQMPAFVAPQVPPVHTHAMVFQGDLKQLLTGMQLPDWWLKNAAGCQCDVYVVPTSGLASPWGNFSAFQVKANNLAQVFLPQLPIMQGPKGIHYMHKNLVGMDGEVFIKRLQQYSLIELAQGDAFLMDAETAERCCKQLKGHADTATALDASSGCRGAPARRQLVDAVRRLHPQGIRYANLWALVPSAIGSQTLHRTDPKRFPLPTPNTLSVWLGHPLHSDVPDVRDPRMSLPINMSLYLMQDGGCFHKPASAPRTSPHPLPQGNRIARGTWLPKGRQLHNRLQRPN